MAKKARIKSKSGGNRLWPVALACAVALAAGLLAGSGALAGLSGGPSDAMAGLRFSEVQNHNVFTLLTDDGEAPAWIEIENTGASAVSLHGVGLARDDKVNKIFVFPDIRLGAGEFVLVYADDKARATLSGDLHAPFRLPSAGGVTLYLFDASQNLLDSVEAPGMAADESYCRAQDGSWSVSVQATPGARNDVIADRALAVHEGDVVISEAMSDNRTVFPDEDGVCGDYVELYNRADHEVRLAGYFLSDKTEKPGKWALPDVALPAGGHLAIHCDGENRADDPAHLHAPFKLSNGETLLLSDDRGRVNSLVTLPEALLSGQAYSLVEGPVSGEAPAVGRWSTEIAPTPNRENTAEAALQLDAQARAQRSPKVIISELMAVPESETYDWVELYNTTSEAVDLSGWGLSDRPDKPRKWQFPAGTIVDPNGYLAVFMVGATGGSAGQYLTAPFALPGEGGFTATLSDPNGGILDAMYVPPQYSGVSYGRSAGGDCGYFAMASPLAPNDAQTVKGRAPAPTYSVMGGVFDGGDAFEVTMTAEAGARIYYTLDCSDPGESSMLYDGTPIQVSSNTILRTRVYRDGWLPSFMDCQSYLFDVQAASEAPYVVSLVSDPVGLFSDESGIMVKGPNAYEKFPFGDYGRGANFWMDWEREAHVELFTNDGTAVSQECGIKLHGRNTRAYDLKSFKVMAKSKYGKKMFSWPIFHDRPWDEYEAFILRYSGQDHRYAFMRDAVLTSMAADTSVMYMEAEECIVYLNGEYYSAMYIRENISPFSLARREGWDGQEDALDLVKSGSDVRQGSDETYVALKDWLGSHDNTTQEACDVIDAAVDIDNFLEFAALQIVIGTPDTVNVKRYRNPLTDGKWRWVLYDVDRGMRDNTNGFEILAQGTNRALFKACMDNPTLRDRFLDKLNTALATYLSPQHMSDAVSAQFQRLKPLMPQYLEMIGLSQDTYASRVKALVSQIGRRPKLVLVQCAKYLNLSDDEMRERFADAIAAIEAYGS